MTVEWFPLAPTDSTSSRITLDFGLRSANRHFLELVVPGIGGVSFVRQLTWAVAGIALRDTLLDGGRRLRATRLANAVEALGCKAEFLNSPDEVSPRVLGRLAFRRDGAEVASFEDLSDRRHYVQNTFRGTAVRALRTNGGLGFASGSRFDSLKLTEIGLGAAEALLDESRIGQGSSTLRKWLCSWVDKTKEPLWPTLCRVLSPQNPSKAERNIVRARLVDVEGPEGDKRRILAPILEGEKDLPEVARVVRHLRRGGHESYAREVELAQAFGNFFDACIAVISSLSALVDKTGRVKLEAAARSLEAPLGALRECARAYVARQKLIEASSHDDASRLAGTVSTDSGALVLQNLIWREGRVVDLVDGFVHKGPLFKNLIESPDSASDGDGAPAEEDMGTGRTFRLRQFHELLRDTRGKR